MDAKLDNAYLNRLFTQNVIVKTIEKLNYEMLYDLVESKSLSVLGNDVLSYFEAIYNYMLINYRNQYIYQNTLFNKLFNNKIKNKVALSQIPIANSKADFIFINGKAVVYEIKTELDSFFRLEKQIYDYYKAFDHVYLFTSENQVDHAIKSLPYEVGILILESNSRIREIRPALENCNYLSHKEIYELLRKQEINNILFKYTKKLPKEPAAFYYEACYQEFKKIPIEIAYKYALSELKKRKYIDECYLTQIPFQLRSLIYFSCLSRKQLVNFINILCQSILGR